MKLIRQLPNPQLANFAMNDNLFARGCALTIGNFDAVHIGHREILKKLTAVAYKLNLPAVVMTFDPHPQEFFAAHKNQPAARITTTTARFFEIEKTGVDIMLSLKFNQALAQTSAQDFIYKILRDRLRVKHLIIGEDFRFGYRRAGGVEMLQSLSAEGGFAVEVCGGVMHHSRRVSSTWIRELLRGGDLVNAAELLGREYFYAGRIIHGDRRGRDWGFPTINIAVRRVPPLSGIFAVSVAGLGGNLQGVASLGINPSITTCGKTILEAHLFDFAKEVYGKRCCITFHKKIRDEEKFTTDELRKRISMDIKIAREFFATQKAI